MLKNFIDLDYDESMQILNWRNNPNISKWMRNKHINKDEHLKFIKKLKTDPTKLYFLVDDIGVIDFTNITKTKVEIGIYKNPEKQNVGDRLMQNILDYGFDVLQLKKLILYVYEENQKAISLYKRYNFKQTDKKDDMLKMELVNENRKF
jgi:UDP-4-amino-4,6-dideoxy-N-acetyl-beta-L-altrosamine N-acetyltransferase